MPVAGKFHAYAGKETCGDRVVLEGDIGRADEQNADAVGGEGLFLIWLSVTPPHSMIALDHQRALCLHSL